mmetsp:Transcript_35286/g.45277  ORF Transcript_35286/g.45277 Transcript_35286/m.45277 type:complete len:401 (+) Transcript_35286:88-1290(+)|eukprot:CAMPEP_0117879756 /NCGR_PEP_ID=MMETSP0950-20121206/15710_1 /TAXON_ID=44440 /ORGANISM="Chattonella subsalsa, Strain CCMP2191" /LENGTH=400 /DNA_ID=CAMNT_0005734465 /DNA_START=23 /DNA_END=1225 /DNA_ORIENTATION=-
MDNRGGRRQRGEGTVRFRCNFRNTVYDVLKSRGWKETNSETNWDIHWADRDWVYDVFDSMHLESWQRLNHYRNGRELCRKDLLVKNIKRKKRQLEKEGAYDEAQAYNFLPVSFVLPREYAMFVEEFKRQGGVWIMKPIGSAQGKGIFLFTRLSEISEWRTDFKQRLDRKDRQEPQVEAYIVQRYIMDPYLVGGKKFDLRLYALVTNFSPLTVWMHRTGFARFTNTRYNNDIKNIENMFVHLTNVVMINDKHCFELYGYDVMIDSSLKPWLIEVNASPSLSANTQEDYLLKSQMLNDAFDIIDLEGKMQGDEEHVGGFDLIYDDGYVDIDPTKCGYSTYLGAVCHEKETFGDPTNTDYGHFFLANYGSREQKAAIPEPLRLGKSASNEDIDGQEVQHAKGK